MILSSREYVVLLGLKGISFHGSDHSKTAKVSRSLVTGWADTRLCPHYTTKQCFPLITVSRQNSISATFQSRGLDSRFVESPRGLSGTTAGLLLPM